MQEEYSAPNENPLAAAAGVFLGFPAAVFLALLATKMLPWVTLRTPGVLIAIALGWLTAAVVAWNAISISLAYIATVPRVPALLRRLLTLFIAKLGSPAARALLHRSAGTALGVGLALGGTGAAMAASHSPFLAAPHQASPHHATLSVVELTYADDAVQSGQSPHEYAPQVSPEQIGEDLLWPQHLRNATPEPPNAAALPSPEPQRYSPTPSESSGSPQPPSPQPSSTGPASPQPLSPGPVSPDSHTVEAGESLWSIASDILGADSPHQDVAALWPRIHEANRDVIGNDPNLIHPGQVLAIPEVAS